MVVFVPLKRSAARAPKPSVHAPLLMLPACRPHASLAVEPLPSLSGNRRTVRESHTEMGTAVGVAVKVIPGPGVASTSGGVTAPVWGVRTILFTQLLFENCAPVVDQTS